MMLFNKRSNMQQDVTAGRGPAHFMFPPGPGRFNVPAVEPPKAKLTGTALGHLERVQQVLNVIERTTPLIEEYGPMVRNLPRMYQLMKAFKSIEKEEKAENTEGKSEETAVAEVLPPVSELTEAEKQPINKTKQVKGKPAPKLFI